MRDSEHLVKYFGLSSESCEQLLRGHKYWSDMTKFSFLEYYSGIRTLWAGENGEGIEPFFVFWE